MALVFGHTCVSVDAIICFHYNVACISGGSERRTGVGSAGRDPCSHIDGQSGGVIASGFSLAEKTGKQQTQIRLHITLCFYKSQ